MQKLFIFFVSLFFVRIAGIAQVVPSDTTSYLNNSVVEEDSTESYAQEFKRDSYKFQWGLRGAINQSRLFVSDISPVRISSNGNPILQNGRLVRNVLQNNSKYDPGFSAGIIGRISRGSFFLQPEVVYTRKGGTYDVLDVSEKVLDRVNARFDLIDIPVLIGIKFRKGRVFFGPVGSFAFRLNDAFKNNLKNYTTEKLSSSFLERPILNFQTGLGFQFGKFFIDGRYENGFSNYTNIDIGPDSNPSRFRFSANLFQISVGFFQ